MFVNYKFRSNLVESLLSMDEKLQETKEVEYEKSTKKNFFPRFEFPSVAKPWPLMKSTNG
jgi:hypothetical protein